ncbi:MAG: rhodanese-like domain-containing protein [Gemmatimonadaceae bacterium]
MRVRRIVTVVFLSCAALPAFRLPAQRNNSPLVIQPQQLSRLMGDRSLVILQVGPKEDYDAGHIAGARFVRLDDVSAPRIEGAPALELPTEADLRTALERLGVSDKSTIVVVAGADWASPSTRLVFTLQAAGLSGRVRWLDGGSIAWKAAGLPLTKDVPPAATPGRLTVPADRSIVVDADWVQAHGREPGYRLIDARDPVFYEGPGMPEHHAKGGHIPGAKNIPFTTVMDDSLHVRPSAELAQLFAAAGVQPGDTIVGYCHIGQQATAMLFAARVLGHPIKLYDGSFTDWDARKLPVENPHPDKKP